jgi:hypothetical protein
VVGGFGWHDALQEGCGVFKAFKRVEEDNFMFYDKPAP